MNAKITKLADAADAPSKAEICQVLCGLAEMVHDSNSAKGKFNGSPDELREIVCLKHAEDIVKQDQLWRP